MTEQNVLGMEVRWDIRPLMRRQGIPSVRELHRRLKTLDPGAIELARLAQFVKRPPARISLRTLVGLCQVLDCEISNIVGIMPRL